MSGLRSESEIAEGLDIELANRRRASAVADRNVADLVELACMLEVAASHVRPSDEFRARSRRRLVMHMARSSRQQRALRPSFMDRARVWTARLAAGLGTLTLAGAAAASASASALPGDTLYAVKQVTEAAALQLAPTDSLRQDILVHQADTRLDETAQLLQQRRDSDAASGAAHYEQTLAALPTSSSSQSIEPEMAKNQARLTQLLQTAPAPAREGLERALAATERHTEAVPRNEVVIPALTATPAAGQSEHPTEIADSEPADVRPSVPAHEKDRALGSSSADGGPATSDAANLSNQTHLTPVDAEPDVATAKASEVPPPRTMEESHASAHADAQPARSTEAATRENPPPATTQPSRSAPDRSGAAPRPAPPGHGHR